MFFILSKLLLIFIFPFTWFMALLAAALIVKKRRRKRNLFIASAMVFWLFSNPFLLDVFAKHWDIQPVPLTQKTYSCAILLGGFSGEDANGHGVFNTNVDRFIQTLELFKTGKIQRILISGGNGNLGTSKFMEADWAKSQFELLGVPDSCIIIEDRSRNTLENAAFSKPILLKNNLKPPYLLVTSGFHMRRALSIFNKQKIPVIPYPCSYFAGNNKWEIFDLIPDPAVFGGWNFYIKEAVGMLVNRFR